MNYPKPILTVDIAVIRLSGMTLEIALVPRLDDPFKGHLSMPGGFVHLDKDASTDGTALRVLRTKLGFTPSHLEQVLTASGPHRDPRGWSASVLYIALLNQSQSQALQSASPSAQWHPLDLLPAGLAFDHQHLIAAAAQRLRSKSQYSTMAAHLLPDTFSMSELHEAYQAVLGTRIDPANFRRKMIDLGGLKEVGLNADTAGRGRPRTLFSLADSERLALFDRSIS